MFPERAAGLLIPLFALRSADDFGRGDLSGLAAAGELAQAMGQRLLLLLPIDETPPGEASPYSASSVFAIDSLYIATNGLNGVSTAALAAARKAVESSPRDLVRLRTVKEGLLDLAFEHFRTRAGSAEREAVAQYTEANRGWLDDYALFHAFKHKFKGADWSDWPSALSGHDPGAIADAGRALAPTIERLKFRQFLAHTQWSNARDDLRRRGVLLGGDLAFSPARESAEVWARQSMFDLTRSVGAPPDAFSAIGQRWGLPMPDWVRMRADGFSFMRARVQRARALYDFIRVDHVVGLFRTYGYPNGEETLGAFDPLEEEAQHEQGEELLRLILAEAGPMRIIAEDLGVIPPFVRTTLARLDVPSYKIIRWERDWKAPDQPFLDPATYPAASLVTTGTHDTDTLVEWWETIDEEERRRFVEDLGLGDASGPVSATFDEKLLDALLAALYASPARLAILPIQDLFGWKDRINVPGTVNGNNWRWRLPFDPSQAAADPKLRARIAKIRALAERTERF